MMAVQNLDSLPPDDLSHPQDKPQLRRFASGVNKRNSQRRDGFPPLASPRTGNLDLLLEVTQSRRQLDTLVVGPAAGQQGIEVKNAQRNRHVTAGRQGQLRRGWETSI